MQPGDQGVANFAQGIHIEYDGVVDAAIQQAEQFERSRTAAGRNASLQQRRNGSSASLLVRRHHKYAQLIHFPSHPNPKSRIAAGLSCLAAGDAVETVWRLVAQQLQSRFVKFAKFDGCWHDFVRDPPPELSFVYTNFPTPQQEAATRTCAAPPRDTTPPMKIASLEDDLDQARRIQQVLTAAGYTCSSYQQSRDLLSAMRNESFDLVLLDWHLPDIDGDDVVRWLRANIGPRIPVIFLTNRSSEDDLVEGLRAGADDYIVKPLRPLELLARVAAPLRRSQIAEPADESFDVANYRVEPSARTIALNGKAVTLAPKEFELALLFFRNLGRLMSRDVLAECVEQEIPATSRTLDTHLSNIRQSCSCGRNTACA